MSNMYPAEMDDSGIRVEGLISAPSTHRSNRSVIHIFVNGRVVQNRSLVYALEEAYSGFLMVGRHPLAAVHLWLPPDEVDANVHPSKSEVRFSRERDVHGLLHRAVVNALLTTRLAKPGESISIVASGDGAPFEIGLPFAEETAPSPPDAQQALLPDVPLLRVFGQTKEAFIIAEGPDGLYMIDQHAAHERILFDQLDTQLTNGGVDSQPLLEPAALDLEPGQVQALDENGELLQRSGFAIEPFGSSGCLIRAVPALSVRSKPGDLVDEVLRELQNLGEPDAARERALAAMACKGAVKAGQTLDVREMREIVSQLEQTFRPATCPHGRPTMIHLSHTQLEREFGRR